MDSRHALVWGRAPAVSRQLAVLAVGLFGLVSAVFYTDLNTLWPAPLMASGAVILALIAGLVAYYNEGLVVAWSLTVGTALPGFVFYPPRGPMFAVTPATAPAAIGEALAVAIGLGSLGFLGGAGLRRRVDRLRGERYVPSASVLPTFLVGRNRRQATRWLLVAMAEFVTVFALAVSGQVPYGVGPAGQLGIAVLVVLMAGPAAWVAFRNRGLVVAWSLAFAPLFGVFLAIQLQFVGTPAPDRPVLYAFGTAAMVAIPVGTLAFLLGVAAHRVRGQLPRLPGRLVEPE